GTRWAGGGRRRGARLMWVLQSSWLLLGTRGRNRGGARRKAAVGSTGVGSPRRAGPIQPREARCGAPSDSRGAAWPREHSCQGSVRRAGYGTRPPMADSIRCPSCRAEIPLTEVISHQTEEQLPATLAPEVASREAELRREFEEAKAAGEAELERRAEERVATALADLGSRVAEQDEQLREARERELGLLREKRKLDEEKEKLGLELARRLDEERGKIAAEVRRAASEEHQLELRQKELQVEQMKRQIKDLQESAEQTRAGLLGEAQEREIEDVLRERFRADKIEPVKSGVRG